MVVKRRVTVLLRHSRLSSGSYALPGKAVKKKGEDQRQRPGEASASCWRVALSPQASAQQVRITVLSS